MVITGNWRTCSWVADLTENYNLKETGGLAVWAADGSSNNTIKGFYILLFILFNLIKK